MALPQLVYPTDMAVAFEGAAADGASDAFRISASNTAAASFFGRACLAVTGDGEQFVQPTGTAGVFLGILQHSHAIEQSEVTAGAGGLPVNHPGAIIRRGRIWVVTEEAITDITADVFYRFTTPGGGAEALGRFRTDDDTSKALQVAAARWTKVAGAGELTVIELSLP